MTRWLRALSAFPISLPLAFEPAPEPGRFVARQADARIEVACDALTVAWSARESVALRFPGANGSARPVASEPQPGKVHYLTGRDPARWRRNLPLHGRVTCAGFLPGLDLAVHAREGRVEFDVIAAPGADLAAFELSAPGAALEPDGDLALRAGERRLVLRAPVAWQEIGGERRPVGSRFAPRGAGRFGFAVGPHDPNVPLVVDPVLELSTFAGGNQPDTARAVAIDTDGSIVVAGRADSNDFPTTPGAFQEEYAGANDDFERGDAFVMKLAPGGTSLVWATYLGGKDPDAAEDVALGPDGDVFVVGGTASKDFPVTPGAFQIERGKNTSDAFAARLGPDGDTLVYGTYLGGKSLEFANGVAVGPTNEATIVGHTFSKDFPVTPGAFQADRDGGQDAFVTRLSANGASLVWSTFFGGNQGNPFAIDDVAGVALDAFESVYIAGDTLSRNLPVSPDAFDPECGRNDNCQATDAYVAKLSADGCSLLYGTFLGDSDVDSARDLAVDARGHAHVTGFTLDNDFPVTPDAFQPERREGADVFYTEFDAGGTDLVYSTFLGSGDEDSGNGIALSDAPRAHVVGSAGQNNFPIVGPAFQDDFGGETDGFVAVFGGPAANEPALLAGLGFPPVGAFGPFAGTLRVRNAGSAAAANVAASVTFDPALDVDTATPSQGSCVVAAPLVTCTLGALAPGAEAEVDFAGTATQEGVLAASATLTADDAASTRAAACVAAELHDLAVTALKAPKSVKVPAAGTATGKVSAEVENLSNHTERIVDLAMLANLVTLAVAPTGGACGPAAVALDPKSGSKLPLDLEPGRTLKVDFSATFDCAATDFTATATVDHTAIDGLADAVPGNDALSASIDAQPK